jgi:hypothetical protein
MLGIPRAFLVLAFILAACVGTDTNGRAAAGRRRPAALLDVARIGGSEVLDATATDDVERLTLLAPAPFDSVVSYYRRWLPYAGWRVMSETGGPDQRNLYARLGGRSLWIQVFRASDTTTQYVLVGSTAADTVESP